MASRKICVVTGSRADYGLLYWVMRELLAAPAFELQVVATGMHLSPEFGSTWQAIERDGFAIAARVEMLEAGDDSGLGTARSIGRGVAGLAEAYAWLRPDLVLLLGDRFEILAAAQAALVLLIPVAHIAGGDTTEGAIDEAMRHAVSKMAHLHFVTNADSARRVRQLGEDPAHVYAVGSPGIDAIRQVRLLPKAALSAALGFELRARNLLVTYHPATLDGELNRPHCAALLDALEGLGGEVGLLFTHPNADAGGRELSAMIDAFVAAHPNARSFRSLNRELYLSCMKICDAVVGNSSSGLYEAPSLGRPAVNIGDRQQGRLRAASVIDCAPEAKAISQAIGKAWTLDCSGIENPYGDGRSAPRIVERLASLPDYRALLKKRFHDHAVS